MAAAPSKAPIATHLLPYKNQNIDFHEENWLNLEKNTIFRNVIFDELNSDVGLRAQVWSQLR